ncbi:MAG: hypothetical protein QNJ23_06475 [Woeseiaceae bacterium]|nr:hypothetical protein [Woeseiaceae bacterium]
MDSHNSGKHTRHTLATLDAMDKRSRAANVDFTDEPELSVADDVDVGGDPYNSTGRHVIIKSKLNLED